MKKAVIIYGPPGGGKGTQSELLVKKHKFVNFDTGSYLEALLHDPAKQSEKTIKRERKLFDGGKLNTPSWVLRIVKQQVSHISDAGFGLVLSGSPRTIFEAFGDAKTEGLMELLKRKYGKSNIIIFELVLPDSGPISRNSSRLVCSLCKSPILGKYYSDLKICPFCGGKLFKRVLDKPDIIRKRLEVYRERTWPIIAELKKEGFKITQVDGSPMPAKVFENISKHLIQNSGRVHKKRV